MFRKLFIAIILFTGGVLLIALIGTFIKPHDVLVNEDNQYLYYKQYTLYGSDSVINKYHKPIKYLGKCTHKRTVQQLVGTFGKGGHYVTKYITKFEYNGQTIEMKGRDYYDIYNEGDDAIIMECFYPYYEIKILK